MEEPADRESKSVAQPSEAKPAMPTGYNPDLPWRWQFAQQLTGEGIEFGPGCHPLPLGPHVRSMRYCDAFDRPSFAEAFPEAAGEIDGFPETIDYRLNFDRECFVDKIGAGSADFIVANHVLEHLVNPLQFLRQCYELLKDDGLFYIGQPDKRFMFDHTRPRTPLADVVARYSTGETEVSDDRIINFANQVDRSLTPVDLGPSIPSAEDPSARAAIDCHRARSIHVNVWILDDIIELFLYLGRELNLPLQLLDGLSTEHEFVLLFRKTSRREVLDQYPMVLARLWADSTRVLLDRHYRPHLEQISRVTSIGHEKLSWLEQSGRSLQSGQQHLAEQQKHLDSAAQFLMEKLAWVEQAAAGIQESQRHLSQVMSAIHQTAAGLYQSQQHADQTASVLSEKLAWLEQAAAGLQGSQQILHQSGSTTHEKLLWMEQVLRALQAEHGHFNQVTGSVVEKMLWTEQMLVWLQQNLAAVRHHVEPETYRLDLLHGEAAARAA